MKYILKVLFELLLIGIVVGIAVYLIITHYG